MINTTKWLTSLEAGKRVVAMLLIAIGVVWGTYRYSEYQHEGERVEHQKELKEKDIYWMRREDSCNATYNAFILNQLRKIEESQRIVDTTVTRNTQLIKTLKK